jgi:putative toxin-antitoxin system antitoxin component (TIGR02293 family)
MLRGLRILTCVHSVHSLEDMSTAYVSGRVPARYERLVTKQARVARTSKSDLVARYVIERLSRLNFRESRFRDSLSGHEAYLMGRRVAIWEVVAVHEQTKSVDKTARHFGWPRVLVKRALAYASSFPEESPERVAKKPIQHRLFHRRKVAPKTRLPVDESERLWRFAEVLAHATRVFGSQAEAEQWLERPAIGLDHRKPIDLLRTYPGTRLVSEYLMRIEHGVYV